MLKKIFAVILSVFISVSSLSAADINDLQYYTEDYPPYNYVEDGKLTGLGVELLKLVWKEMEAEPKEISVVPWARGYKSALERTGTVLFSTSRIPAREDLFKWACPVAKGTKYVLIGKKGKDFQIDSVGDINDYKVGTIREDIAEQVLISKGLDKSSIDSVSKIELNIKKLDLGRIDFIAYGEDSIYGSIEDSGRNTDDYKTYFLIETTPLCFAFNKEVDDETVSKFQKALKKVVSTDAYKDLKNKF